MNMARYEQETIIGFNEEEKTAGIYTHNKVLRQKLEALARDRPEDCRLVKVSHSGRAVDYAIPKSWIRIVSFFHTPNVTAFGSSAPSSGECEEQPLSRRRLNASSMNAESRQDLFICVSSHKSPFQPVISRPM